MADLTPIEIERQEFKTVWRGYDPTEVRAFLGQIATQITSLIREQERVAEEFEVKAQRLEQVEDYEARLRDALLAASQLGEQTKEEAQREAELLIKEAELRADQLLQNGRQAQRSLINETQALKRQRERLSIELRSVIESHLRMLDNQEEHLKSAQERWRQEDQEWKQHWGESDDLSYRDSYIGRGELVDDNDDALSEARELTLTLGTELGDDLQKGKKFESTLNTSILTPSLPEPLAKRPLTESGLNTKRTTRPFPKLSATSEQDDGLSATHSNRQELTSSVAKLQQVLSVTPRRADAKTDPPLNNEGDDTSNA